MSNAAAFCTCLLCIVGLNLMMLGYSGSTTTHALFLFVGGGLTGGCLFAIATRTGRLRS